MPTHPHSPLRVGAALLMDDGRVFPGCNVENAAFAATVCAERSAISKAVSEGSRSDRRVILALLESVAPTAISSDALGAGGGGGYSSTTCDSARCISGLVLS